MLNQIDVWSVGRAASRYGYDGCSDGPYAEIGYTVEGVGPGVLAAIGICWAGFAPARIHPLMQTVPAAALVAIETTRVYSRVYTRSGHWNGFQPELGPGWAVSRVFAVVFGAFGMAAAPLYQRLRRNPAG